MNRFSVGLAWLGLACLAVVGCSPEEGSSSIGTWELNVPLKTPSFEISDENGSGIAQAGLDSVGLAEVDLVDRALSLKAPVLRATETTALPCTSGSGSASVASNDLNASAPEFNVSGSIKTVLSYSNCSISGLLEINGQMTVDQSWTGYSAATALFDTTDYRITFTNYSQSTDLSGTLSVEGAIDGSVNGSTTILDWALSLSSPATNGLIVTSATTNSVVKNDADSYPSTGAWIIKGANDTSVVTTIVANGLEISINGAQLTIIDW